MPRRRLIPSSRRRRHLSWAGRPHEPKVASLAPGIRDQLSSADVYINVISSTATWKQRPKDIVPRHVFGIYNIECPTAILQQYNVHPRVGLRWSSGQTTCLPPRLNGFDSRRGRSRIFRTGFSLPHTYLASPSSALKTSMLTAAQISPLVRAWVSFLVRNYVMFEQFCGLPGHLICCSSEICEIIWDTNLLLIEVSVILSLLSNNNGIIKFANSTHIYGKMALRRYTKGRGGTLARAVVSHKSEQSSIPSSVTPGFLHAGIVLDVAAAQRVFSGISRFPSPCIPLSLRTRALPFILLRSQKLVTSSPYFSTPFFRFNSGRCRCCSILTFITLIGSEDLAVKSRPNIFILHSLNTVKWISAKERGAWQRRRGVRCALIILPKALSSVPPSFSVPGTRIIRSLDLADARAILHEARGGVELIPRDTDGCLSAPYLTPTQNNPIEDRCVVPSARRRPRSTGTPLRQERPRTTGVNVSEQTVRFAGLLEGGPFPKAPLQPHHRAARVSEVIRDGASCTGKRDWGRIGNESAMASVWDPSQHSPGVISGNHGKPKSGWPDRGIEHRVLPNASPVSYHCATSLGPDQWKRTLFADEVTASSRLYIRRVRVWRRSGFAATLGEGFTPVDDNARPHQARVDYQFLATHGIQRMECPAYSADMDSVEHARSVLERAIANRPTPPAKIQQLTDAAIQEGVVNSEDITDGASCFRKEGSVEGMGSSRTWPLLGTHPIIRLERFRETMGNQNQDGWTGYRTRFLPNACLKAYYCDTSLEIVDFKIAEFTMESLYHSSILGCTTPLRTLSEGIWVALNTKILRADEVETRRVRSGFGIHRWGKREVPEETCRSAASGGSPAGNRTRSVVVGSERPESAVLSDVITTIIAGGESTRERSPGRLRHGLSYGLLAKLRQQEEPQVCYRGLAACAVRSKRLVPLAVLANQEAAVLQKRRGGRVEWRGPGILRLPRVKD
ncbi:hypothetical protein PR048_024005 [Dryococelus australis]|uniref:Uncharacterized protein n=1 Tax=Dryococelus australis TaxID=614101 RepID=A0ABQ9GVS3_9NEOP|nr:hypothetical protein PR048_024005 [Dryococelus australis]